MEPISFCRLDTYGPLIRLAEKQRYYVEDQEGHLSQRTPRFLEDRKANEINKKITQFFADFSQGY
jgi:hypothetical protein